MARQTLSQLLQTFSELYQHADLPAFRTTAQRTIRKLVAQDMASYNEVDFTTGQITAEFDVPGFGAQETADRLQPYMNVHPLIRYINQTGDGTAHRITDFLTQKQFENSEMYRVVYKPIGIRRQMAVAIQTPELVLVGLVSNRRGRDFSERDRTVLNLFRPHLIQAYQNARAVSRLQHERDQLDKIARSKHYGVIIATATGKIDSLIGAARELLGKFLPPDAPGRLPESLRTWLSASLKAPIDISPQLPFLAQRQHELLSVRLLRATAGIYHTLILEPVLPELPARPLQAVGLTLREIEVLQFISHGKSNIEIAKALQTRPRTIQKHLENIFKKLQVQTRGAAAAKARELVSIRQ